MSFLINPYRFAAAGGGGGDYSTEVLADSPLAYWRLGEASGSGTAADASGNGRTGTYTNSPTLGVAGLVAGDTNTAMEVASNTGQCVSVASAAWMAVSEMTVECLVKFGSATDVTNGDAIVSRYASAGGFPWLLWRNTAGRLAFQIRNTADTAHDVQDTVGASLGTTYHVAAVASATDVSLYVGGSQVATVAWTGGGGIQSSTSPIEVARYSQANATTPAAVIDEVAIYGSALSAARIAAHAAAAV